MSHLAPMNHSSLLFLAHHTSPPYLQTSHQITDYLLYLNSCLTGELFQSLN